MTLIPHSEFKSQNRISLLRLLFTSILFLHASTLEARVSVLDDSGSVISLEAPAEKIVSLAPNITELLYSAGAGASISATVSYSDYPEDAVKIPRIGDANNVDIEALLRFKPDLVIFWQSGNSPALYQTLIDSGTTVYLSEPDTLEGIASTIRRFGILAGTETTGQVVSDTFLNTIENLRQEFTGKKPVRVVYQFWNEPIYTVSGKHLISRVIELCGGINIFADLGTLTPRLGIESVLNSNPDIIITSGVDSSRPAWLDKWLSWPELKAVSNGQLYHLPPDLIQRHTARISEGAALMCEMIDRARN